jgi:hypothetical protein
MNLPRHARARRGYPRLFRHGGFEDVDPRIKSCISFENEASAVAGLAFLFCAAVILGFL